jgi:hypothetical protein
MMGAAARLTLVYPHAIKSAFAPDKGFSRRLFRSSSMAEHSAVNRRVVGSSPTCGAKNSNEKGTFAGALHRLRYRLCCNPLVN